MESSQWQTSGPLPAVMLNPDVLRKVVKRKTRGKRTEDIEQQLIYQVEKLPTHVQLSRAHLDGLREEIGAAEDVLSNVYEEIDLFKTREGALNDIIHLLIRMHYGIDLLQIMPAERNAIKGEIEALISNIDQIVATSKHRSIPLLTSYKRIAPFPGATHEHNRADVIFVIDRNRWMRRDVRILAHNAHLLYNDLRDRGIIPMFGVQQFERTSQPSGPLRESAGDFADDLEAIYFSGQTKNALTAIRNALDEQPFRPDAAKMIVMFTDSEAHDDYGNMRTEIIAALNDAGATLFALCVNNRYTKLPFPVYEEIAAGTGGRHINFAQHAMPDVLEELAAAITKRMVEKGARIYTTNDRYVHIGPDPGDSVTIRFPDYSTDKLGLRNLGLDTEEDFRNAVGLIDKALQQATIDRTEKGILFNYLERIVSHFDTIRVFKLDFHI